MSQSIEIADYAGTIINALTSGGVLFTTKADGQVDTMDIGWGSIGVNWGKPVFTAYIRTSRYTSELLRKNPEFTINVPSEKTDKKILGYCGSRSGRDTDKIADLGLTLVESHVVSVPAIAELPLTLECKVLYQQQQVVEDLQSAEKDKWYTKGEPASIAPHVTVYGEIVDAYLLD